MFTHTVLFHQQNLKYNFLNEFYEKEFVIDCLTVVSYVHNVKKCRMSTKSFEVPYFYNQVTEVINVFGIAFVEF